MEPLIKQSPASVAGHQVWLTLAAWVLVFCSGMHHFSLVTADPDLWGHIRFGEEIWRLGALEPTDPYAFTTAGTVWLNHEWLTELIFFGVYQNTGDFGLLTGKLLIGFAVILITAAICSFRQQHPVVLAVIMVLGVIAIAPGFMIRPHLATYLLFTVYILVLHLFFNSNKNRLWVIPPLMAVWVNLHGGFLMGIAILGSVVGWQSLEAIVYRKHGRQLKQLWITLFTTVLASFLNPYGYKLHLFLYHSLKVERAISEWDPVTLLDGSFPAFKSLAVLFILTVFILRKKSLQWETAGLALLLYAALRHQRHIPFFAIMVIPYLVNRISRGISLKQAQFPQMTLKRTSRAIIVLAFFLIGAHQAMAGIGKYRQTDWRIVVDPRVYPVAAVRFMRHNNFQGNLQLPFEWGEYTIWKLHPDCRVSIDGRFRTTYPERVINDHFRARQDPNLLFKVAEKYGADIILTKQRPAIQSVIHNKDPAWLYVYSDPVAVIFIHNSHRNSNLIQVFKNSGFVYRKDAPSLFFP